MGVGVSGDRGGVLLGVGVYSLVITDRTDDCISQLKGPSLLRFGEKKIVCYF